MQIVWEGNWISPNGHSTICRNMTSALSRLGVDVKLRATELPNPKPYAHLIRREFLEMMNRPYRTPQQRIRIIHRTPGDYEREDDLITLGMTYSETTEVPEHWARQVNDCVDGLILASQASADAFLRAGVHVPLWIAPQGVDTHRFRPRARDAKAKADLPRFRFLSVFEWSLRKGYDVLLPAFWEEFRANEDVCLVVKTRSFPDHSTSSPAEYIRGLKKRLGYQKTAPVYLYDGVLPEKRLASLYRLSSAFVLPTRGESIGLPFLEAAAAGLPIVATGWGGQMEFLSASDMFPVDFSLQSVPEFVSGHNESLVGQWAEPDISSLRQQMRRVYRSYVRARRMALRQRKRVVQTRSWDACATRLVQFLEQAAGTPIRGKEKGT
ncbi:glycosyltransferase family 4 protein [Alicyclobacillus tolerans]|uniref:glycosyltransferase family 4 protein n=1 Tax=Alicyclobacillus tolerans TaxID=90970 RepID=UPI001F3D7294|nr:glycosyltransferase family 4 protein [Alicyclobacillus tolerans]MCF8563273.1 glycosyltransferase family 4 protein [Alicyclobacillus tolerans]